MRWTVLFLWTIIIACVWDRMGSCERAEESAKLQIALHAQVSFASSGKVVGSEITCTGFRRAMQKLGHEVQMFYPFEYTNLTAHAWDLVFIEGWFEMIHAFIHEIRRVAPRALVFFFCLDPDFPGLRQVSSLHYTRSHSMHAQVTR